MVAGNTNPEVKRKFLPAPGGRHPSKPKRHWSPQRPCAALPHSQEASHYLRVRGEHNPGPGHCAGTEPPGREALTPDSTAELRCWSSLTSAEPRDQPQMCAPSRWQGPPKILGQRGWRTRWKTRAPSPPPSATFTNLVPLKTGLTPGELVGPSVEPRRKQTPVSAKSTGFKVMNLNSCP